MMIIKNLLFVIYSFVIFIIEVTAYSALNDITIWNGDCTDAASQPLLNNYSKFCDVGYSYNNCASSLDNLRIERFSV